MWLWEPYPPSSEGMPSYALCPVPTSATSVTPVPTTGPPPALQAPVPPCISIPVRLPAPAASFCSVPVGPYHFFSFCTFWPILSLCSSWAAPGTLL